MIGDVACSPADLALECGGRRDHIGESAATDHVTVLVCGSRYRATKLWREGATEPEGYDAGYRYATERHPVASLADLAALLDHLATRPRALVIRGEPRPGVLESIGARRHHDHPERGPGRYEDVPRRWVAHDLDRVPLGRPYDLRDPSQAREAMERLRRMLSAEWRRAACYATLTASAGHGDPARVSARLWYMLDRPASRAELEAWAAATRAPVDVSIYRCVQPIYVARPIYVAPRVDPIECRAGILDGDPLVWLGAYPQARPRREATRTPYVPPPRDDTRDAAGRRAATRILDTCAQTLARASEGDRHASMIRVAHALGGLTPGGWLTRAEIHRELAAAARTAGLTGARESEVMRTISDGIESGSREPWDPDVATRARVDLSRLLGRLRGAA